MYRDFGAGDWFFEIEETTGAELWARLRAVHEDRPAARAASRAHHGRHRRTAAAHGRGQRSDGRRCTH
jgi:hypothetical protein